MNILTEKYLAIDESWFAHYIANQPAGGLLIPDSEVKYVAATTLSERELGWMGIATMKNSSGKLVALISIRGAIDTYDTERIIEKVTAAVDNSKVVAIVLKMNSPGGVVNGIVEAANAIAAAANKKPLLSYTSFYCASAALWLEAPATESWIMSTKSTAKGSLGIMATYMSEAKRMKDAGYDVRVLRSAGSENKNLLNRYEPINEKALAAEQLLIDTMREEFLAFVRKYRPQVSASIGGEMYHGQAVITAGLADRVGSLQDVIRRAFYLGMKA